MMENFIASQIQHNKEFINQNIHTNELVKQLANGHQTELRQRVNADTRLYKLQEILRDDGDNDDLGTSYQTLQVNQ